MCLLDRELLFVVILKWCVSREKGEGRRERREAVKVCKSTEKGESRMNVHTSAFVDHMAKRK